MCFTERLLTEEDSIKLYVERIFFEAHLKILQRVLMKEILTEPYNVFRSN